MEQQQAQPNVVQSNKPTNKKPITFGKMFLVFLYQNITVSFIIFIPMMIGIMLGFFAKYKDGFAGASSSVFEERLMQNLDNSIFMMLFLAISVITLILVVIAIYQDIMKHFDINKDNFKIAVKYIGILFVVRILLSFDFIYIVINILAIGLLYTLFEKRLVQGQPILEKQILSGRNVMVIVFISFIISFGAVYFL